ncbi:MAG TPA: glycosyltransferase, partial [bacterium]|nr:glycosyltransferase [bacterium]
MTRKIVVLRIQHNFVEPTNHRLLDELAKFPELEVHALCPRWGVESGNLRVLKSSPRSNLSIGRTVFTKHYATTAYASHLGGMIKSLKPDIINIHDEPYSLTTGQILFLRSIFSPDSKVVFCSAQNIYKSYPPPFSMIEEWNYRTAAAGYGCCEGVKEVVRAKGFSGPFEILPLGLDPELFEFRHRTAVAGRAAVIGFVGRIVKEKGVFTLLSAFEDVVKHVDARLVFIGSGPDEDHLK